MVTLGVAPVFLKIKSSRQSERVFCSLNKVHVHVEVVAILVLEILLAFAINLGHVVILAIDLHPVNRRFGFGHHGNLVVVLDFLINDLGHIGHLINFLLIEEFGGGLLIDELGLGLLVNDLGHIRHLLNVLLINEFGGGLLIDELGRGLLINDLGHIRHLLNVLLIDEFGGGLLIKDLGHHRHLLSVLLINDFLLLFVVSIRRGGRLLRAGAA